MKRYLKYVSITLVLVFTFVLNVKADTKVYINLNDLTTSNNKNDYTALTTYENLDDFLKVYNSNKLPDVYVTKFLYDGISSVKTPDLDDFVDASSNDAKIKTLEITVINIKSAGNYEFSGTIKGAMIAVNTNSVINDINIYLNNVNLDTDSKKAPAIYVYNKDKNYTSSKVIIKTVENSKNYLEGGKLKKVSLIGSDELSKYSSYYSETALTNYNTYTNYYGIYTSEQIKNILFATVQADSEDLQDGDPYYFYKASGAISSDIDLYFDGTGYLKVTSKNKEGIETKGNLTFSGGKGDYEIHAQDDCLNTTTASSSNTTVRNDLTINVNSLFAIVDSDGDEGDAIDSNGKLTINGGTIIALAHPTSPDAGLDSNGGTYINGGTVIATGNMVDEIGGESKNKYIYASLNTSIEADTLIVIKDQDDNVIVAFKAQNAFKNILYSSIDLSYASYKIYKGGTIKGEQTNGLYTKVDNYTNGEEVSYTDNSTRNNQSATQTEKMNIEKVLLIALICEVAGLLITILISVLTNKKTENDKLLEEF